METLFDKLKSNKRIPMHMPGHKRNSKKFPYLKGFSDIDITEIDGFDNLHLASGILKRSMETAAQLAGAKRAFYLVNGSTCGILAVICAVLGKNDKVIVARNCHKSVYNGIELSGAVPVFVYPKGGKYGICGSLEPSSVEQKIEENPDAKLVIVTSPTYEGVISDIEAICTAAHKRDIPILVDAAHGAHLGFGNFPKSAVSFGADAVVSSLHKTLPSLTQTAICYLSGELIDGDALSERLALFETSSPSYILLSSIDGCINALKMRGKEIFTEWEKGLESFCKDISGLENIEILKNDDGEFFGLDKSKIVLLPKNQSGAELAQKLRLLGIEPEMAAPTYVICMTGAGESRKSLKKLAKALKRIDSGGIKAEKAEKHKTGMAASAVKNGEFCEIEAAEGRISAGYVWAYPPEIPILLPNEEISGEAVKELCKYRENGFSLFGDISDGKILVTKST